MFILEVYDLDECWSTFGVFSDLSDLDRAKCYVCMAYSQKFDLELDDSDFKVTEVELGQYLLKEIGL